MNLTDLRALPSRVPSVARALAPAGIFFLFVVVDAYRIAQQVPGSFFGDEWRYVYYAKNLLHGFYSPRDRVFLWNGPGYPLVLVPFVRADWIDGGRFTNAVWHGGAMAYAWLSLRSRMRVRWALAATAAFSGETWLAAILGRDVT